MKCISQRLNSVKPSPTKEITRKARLMKKNGEDVLTLSQGEPDFNTPRHIKEAAKSAIDKGVTRYTDVAGKLSLREAISEQLFENEGVQYSTDQITVSCGAKQVIFNALMALVSKGDEVIIPAPYWVSYPDMVRMVDGTPVIVKCSAEEKFKLTPQSLDNAITPATRCIILNSPNNPTGAVYSQEELSTLVQVIERYPNIVVISDEIYQDICFNHQRAPSMVKFEAQLRDRLLIVNGVSKAFAMTGWRVGYGAGPIEIIKAMNVVQSQSSSHTSSVSQAAAEAAYRGSMEAVREYTASYRLRRDLMIENLALMEEIDVIMPEGAFYIFASCQRLLGYSNPLDEIMENDIVFSRYLLEVYKVAVVPGTAFGAPGHIRISYATDEETLKEACRRLAHACGSLTENSHK